MLLDTVRCWEMLCQRRKLCTARPMLCNSDCSAVAQTQYSSTLEIDRVEALSEWIAHHSSQHCISVLPGLILCYLSLLLLLFVTYAIDRRYSVWLSVCLPFCQSLPCVYAFFPLAAFCDFCVNKLTGKRRRIITNVRAFFSQQRKPCFFMINSRAINCAVLLRLDPASSLHINWYMYFGTSARNQEIWRHTYRHALHSYTTCIHTCSTFSRYWAYWTYSTRIQTHNQKSPTKLNVCCAFSCRYDTKTFEFVVVNIIKECIHELRL